MKAHTIAESHVLQAAKILVRNLIGEKDAAKLDRVSLSNDTVRRRIKEMSDDISNQVTAGIRASTFGFAIQVDESTDVTNCCQLLVYARYTEGNDAKTELMMSEELSETTKGKDIFNLLDKFFKQNHLDWKISWMYNRWCSFYAWSKVRVSSLCKSYATKSHFCLLFYTQICSSCQSNATGIIVMLKSNHQDCEFHKSVSAEYAIVCKALRRSWFQLQISSSSH